MHDASVAFLETDGRTDGRSGGQSGGVHSTDLRRHQSVQADSLVSAVELAWLGRMAKWAACIIGSLSLNGRHGCDMFCGATVSITEIKSGSGGGVGDGKVQDEQG